MSLRVWLPLDGTLENKGISNLQFSNENTTSIVVDPLGKIGSCYKKSAVRGPGRIVSDGTILLDGDLSMCCWAKVTGTYQDTAQGLVTNHNTAAYTGFGINVKQVSTTDYRICCSTGNGTARTYKNYYGTTNIKDEWHHLALTYDSTKHQFQLWVDGVVEKTQAYTNAAQADKIMVFAWATDSTAITYYPACMLNDVRIYDHCLSAAEVREIAQGLVLHYKLDTYNLFNPNTLTQDIYLLSNGNTSTSGAIGNWCLTDYIPVFPSTSYIGYNLVNGGNGNPSICFYDKNKIYTRGQTIAANTPLSITTTDTEYYVRISIRITDNDITKMQFLEIPTIIQDSSGYGHNGTINGNITLNNSSIRYNSCIYSEDGGSNYIQTQTLAMPTDAITLNIWFKSSNKTPTNNYHMIIDSAGSSTARQYYEMCVHSSGYFRSGLMVNGTRYAGNCSTKTACDGTWHMLTTTYDGATIKRYYDAELESSTAVTSTTGLQPSATLRLFKDGHSSYACVDASLSDFRLYATPLLDTDIKQLYNVGMKVDKLGNVHTNEFVENNNNIWKRENIIPYRKNGSSAETIFNKNGKDYIKLWPAQFYQNITINDTVTSCVLYKEFIPNTQYVFDMWFDTSEMTGTNYLIITYTDNTQNTDLQVPKDGADEWLHRRVITDPNKSVLRVGMRYGTNTPLAVSLDSYIGPVSKPQLKKTSQLRATTINENEVIARIYKSGDIGTQQIIEK